VTIQNSEIVSNTARLGGGIHNRFVNSIITLTQVLVSGNSAFDGGGIYNSDGTAIIGAGVLMLNTASRDGGGIYNIFGAANISASTLMSNTAGRDGGGLINLSGGAIVSASTFLSNTASRDGGGVFTFADTAIQNATFSGNSAGEDGGGLANESKTTLQNATFSGNSATNGGGIHQYSGTALTLKNVALQLSSRGGNCYVATIGGAIVSSGYNLADDGSCTFPQPSDKNNTDPMLSPLEYHGGPTLTHLPLPGSPLVDGGLCIPDLLTDQRGVARPQGAACDIGAVESRPEDYLLKKTFVPITVR
jgi:predicted outer membrane repeat protein